MHDRLFKLEAFQGLGSLSVHNVYIVEGIMNVPKQGDLLITTSMRILPQERKELERLAAIEERSVSQIARRLLRDQLRRIVEGDKR